VASQLDDKIILSPPLPYLLRQLLHITPKDALSGPEYLPEPVTFFRKMESWISG